MKKTAKTIAHTIRICTFLHQVTWYLGNKKLVPDGTNISVTVEGTKRTLTIHDAQLKHVGEINARTNKDRSDAHLHVGVLNEIIKAVTSDAFRSRKDGNVDVSIFIVQVNRRNGFCCGEGGGDAVCGG